MIQIYADGVLAYDSRLKEAGKDYTLLGLKVTTGLNKGGTATITMPPGHPAYNFYTSYRTVVEIYRDDVLLFRGRALYPADDFCNRRAVTCEGELCFFQDAVSRPYLYQDTPAAIFAAVVADYNAQVEEFKQFKVGEVTVTDANDYIRLESETAEQKLATINKLLERCGGYITFSTDEDGARVVNWYSELVGQSSQVIEFGSNLLNFSRTGANTDLATAVLPYGAKDDTTGERLTIESVNNGVDYIQDDEAVALRGVIMKSVTWDDVTTPANLLTKARKYLQENRQIVTSLELTAVDLSYLSAKATDPTTAVADVAVADLAVVGNDALTVGFDSYKVGDKIRVKSKPHAVDEYFQLTERTEDLLDPSQGSITLGKDIRTLTGADVAGDNQSRSDLQKTSQSIKKEYQLNITKSEQRTASLIQQQADNIKLEVTNGKPGQTATITLTVNGKTQTGEIDLKGLVTFTNLLTAGQTEIHGANITTGKIDADRIDTDALFAKDITMTGQFKSTAQGYLPMTVDDYYQLLYYTRFPSEIPAEQFAAWDLNGDGSVDLSDMSVAQKLLGGTMSVAELGAAFRSTITIHINMGDLEKTIHIFGTNAWGSLIETYIGADPNTGTFATKAHVDGMMTYDPMRGSSTLFQVDSGGNKMYFNPPMWPGTEYKTLETWNGNPVYTMLVDCGGMVNGKRVDVNVEHSHILRHAATMGGNSLPLINYETYVTAQHVGQTAIAILMYSGSESFQGMSTYTQIWYTKE